MFSQSAGKSAFVRLNVIYVNEILDIEGIEGDEGIGFTSEFTFVFEDLETIYQTIGIEVGFITSEWEVSSGGLTAEIDTDLIPVLFNYTIGGIVEESGFLWEVGAGLGGYYADFSLDTNFAGSDDEDDFMFGGQVFGSIGYRFMEGLDLLGGLRYMLAEDASIDGEDIEVINSVAFDVSVNFSF